MSSLKPLLLLVEDEPQMQRLLGTALEVQDFRVVRAGSVKEALVMATTHNPDLVLLDLGLPDGDGLVFIQSVRGWSQVPILVLSARGREADKVGALDAGADDYMTKPFGMAELLARVRVALRRSRRDLLGEAVVIRAERLEIDLAKRDVRVQGGQVHLTPLEYKLLTLLAAHPGRVLTHRQILREVWGAAYADQTQYLRVLMAQLRRKVEEDPSRPRLLLTETGVGYRFRDVEEPGPATV